MSRPVNIVSLRQKIRNIENDQAREAQRENVMALVVVAQMLPQGVVKGGSAMAVRYGSGARATKDLDAARQQDEDHFLDELEDKLEAGWQGFTGRVKQVKKPSPAGVLPQYVMTPFDIKLQYEGKDWKTVRLEVAHNELHVADSVDRQISDELSSLFMDLGFDAPGPVPVMKPEHQIAQKIHAATFPNSQRAHDLVDLQILVTNEDIDYSKAKELCEQTFKYRGDHSWPPEFVRGEDWDEIYRAAVENMTLPSVEILDLDDAIRWGNDLVKRIDCG